MADDKPTAVTDLVERRRKTLDGKYFTIRRPQYPECSHRNRGVTLNEGTRKVHCLCGAEIDPFDALLIYAHEERRLLSTRAAIDEAAKKEQEKKARRPHFKQHVGFASRYDGTRRIGFDMKLECGHSVFWDIRGRRRQSAPRGVTCNECYRAEQLKAKGIAVVGVGNSLLVNAVDPHVGGTTE